MRDKETEDIMILGGVAIMIQLPLLGLVLNDVSLETMPMHCATYSLSGLAACVNFVSLLVLMEETQEEDFAYDFVSGNLILMASSSVGCILLLQYNGIITVMNLLVSSYASCMCTLAAVFITSIPSVKRHDVIHRWISRLFNWLREGLSFRS